MPIRRKKARSGRFGLWCRAAANTRKFQHTPPFLLHNPGDCKTGDMSVLLLRSNRCRWCDLLFCVCRCCWRGQAYCCDQCRLAAKRKLHRQAQRRYRQTEKGKKAHRLAENRRRYSLSEKKQKNMDDASSTAISAWCMRIVRDVRTLLFPVETPPRCHFCGSYGLVVNEFPRRGYG